MRANSAGGYLQAWADFDRDFVFEPEERFITNFLLDPGLNTDPLLAIDVPSTISAGALAIRFRYGEFGIDLPTGAALGGEVEDYYETVSVPIISQSLDGDFNGDFQVDGDDFLIWQANFGTTSGASLADGDADLDGDVDGDDFLVWQANFGASAGNGSAVIEESTEPAVGTAQVRIGTRSGPSGRRS